MAKGLTYAQTGVDYNAMDPFKRKAQLSARTTAGNIRRLNAGEFAEFEPSRGESVYLIEAAKSYFAHVEEGLGTKNLVADAMYKLTGRTYYDHIAQDTVAMIVNDMITLGALPLSVAMHLAVEDSSWFKDEKRSDDLIAGWRKACDLSGCTWGGGETPTLKDIVVPGTCVLSGSAIGLVKPKERLLSTARIKEGDAIVFCGSSGIHANGLTLARRIASKFKNGYLTELPHGRSFGETLLDPTYIYVKLVEALLDAGVDVHYGINVTGHGWRKIMRAPQQLSYVIDWIPDPGDVFKFIHEHGPVDDREGYGNLNEGVGFVLLVEQSHVMKMRDVACALDLPYFVIQAGEVERGERRVVIRPKKLEFKGNELGVR